MDHDQFAIAENGMREIALIGQAFEKERSMSKLIVLLDSLREIRADITAIDLPSLPVDKRERVSMWLSTVDGWIQAFEKLTRM